MIVSRIEKKKASSGKRKITIQKRIRYDDIRGGFYPPVMKNIEIKGGWLEAESKEDFSKLAIDHSINGGIIHCYNSKKNLKNYDTYKDVVVKGFAYSEDYICHGIGQELGFCKIWIPIEEIERAKRLIKKRGFK